MQANYLEVVEMTREEKIEMYMQAPKRKLAEMLFEANRQLEILTPIVYIDGKRVETRHERCDCIDYDTTV